MKEILLTSSVLIFALLALRRLFRRTISRRMQYALWALVLVRLLIPGSLGSMAHNVLTVTEPVQTAVAERLEDSALYLPTAREPLSMHPNAPDLAPELAFPDGASSAWLIENDETAVQYRRISTAEVLTYVWYAGMLAVGAWFLFTNLRFSRALRRARTPYPVDNCRYPVYLVPELSSPCLFGVFRPVIYLNDTAASPEALRFVLAHEQTHARHLDPLWSLLRGVCLTVYWFDPLVWIAAMLSREDCELACDEGTLRILGETERIAYGKTLLSLVPVRDKPQNPLLGATTMTSGKKSLKERITRIAENRQAKTAAVFAVLALTILVCAVSFTGNRNVKNPHIFEDAPVESITLFNSLTGESATYFDKTDAPEIKALMSHLAKLRQGRKIPQPAPGSTELSIRVVYQDGHTVKCGNDSFSSEGKTYQVLVTSEAANRPALSAWSWEAMWEAYCPKVTWDHGFDDDYVLSTMYAIQADSIRNPDNLGENVTAQALADALKIAALNPLTEEEAAAFRAGKADLYCWWIWSVYLEGGPDSFGPDDAHLLISCGFPQNIVTVELRKSEQSGTVIVKDPALYQLVRHSNDYEETIDVAAYQQYCEILEPQMETTFETMNQNGEYSGYILTRFAKAYTYDAPDGRGCVELYYFDYALLLEDAESFTNYAGGMYLDSAERIQGFNGGGMLAVCLQNGSTIYTEFMGNDFWFDGKNIEHSEVRKHVDTRLADLLDCALQANQK